MYLPAAAQAKQDSDVTQSESKPARPEPQNMTEDSCAATCASYTMTTRADGAVARGSGSWWQRAVLRELEEVGATWDPAELAELKAATQRCTVHSLEIRLGAARPDGRDCVQHRIMMTGMPVGCSAASHHVDHRVETRTQVLMLKGRGEKKTQCSCSARTSTLHHSKWRCNAAQTSSALRHTEDGDQLVDAAAMLEVVCCCGCIGRCSSCKRAALAARPRPRPPRPSLSRVCCRAKSRFSILARAVLLSPSRLGAALPALPAVDDEAAEALAEALAEAVAMTSAMVTEASAAAGRAAGSGRRARIGPAAAAAAVRALRGP